MEVRNRFKGLYLIDRVPDELWTEVFEVVQRIARRDKKACVWGAGEKVKKVCFSYLACKMQIIKDF